MKNNSAAIKHAARAATALLAIAVLSASWAGLGVWRAWATVERVRFDTEAARVALSDPVEMAAEPASPDSIPFQGSPPSTVTVEGAPPPVIDREPPSAGTAPAAPPTLPDGVGRTFLVIGSDATEGLAGQRADVIVLVALPEGGDPPVMVSLPRDLYLPNPCTHQFSRINANLNGCGEAATGPELLAIAVEDFTGIAIDHFIAFEIEGFIAVIDRLNGIEVCLDHAVRDGPYAETLFPAGCTVANGEQMLAWVRSRSTQELIDGVWQTVPGVNDLHRNRRQRALLIDILGRVGRFRSITELTSLAGDLADAFTLDEDLSLGTAIGLAWDLRDIDAAAILQPEIPVADYITSGGAMVLIPQDSFANVLSSAGAGDLLGS